MATLMEQCCKRETERKRDYRYEYLHRSDSFPVSRLYTVPLVIPLLCEPTPGGNGLDVVADGVVEKPGLSLPEYISQDCHYIAKRALRNEKA